ncbi:MAG TPA: ABC transporter ATP-binding protein [Methylomirabilota bacterium]|nr:ABC transporter ATP-binding protein [Methylomirabilota bacterium]
MPASAATALPLTIRGVSKSYGPVRALDRVDLDVRSGEVITLLGPSGSGKTTLLLVLAGFIRPDCGSVRFGEEEVVRTPPHRRNVGMVFQNYALFPHMTVFGNVAYPLRLRGVGAAEITRRVGRVLELVHLSGFEERRVDQLSGGQRQRVALARAIVFEPRVLLMDEPLSALDKKLRERMQIEIRRLHGALGMTTVYVTHDQREALTLSDRVAVIHQGRIIQVDRPERLYERPGTRFVADFVGESTFLPVAREGGRLTLNGRALALDGPPPPGDGRLLLVVRPEKLTLLPAGAAAEYNCLEGTVKERVYQGESFLLHVTLGDGTELAVRSPSRRETVAAVPEPGGRIRLGLHLADTIVVAEDGQ